MRKRHSQLPAQSIVSILAKNHDREHEDDLGRHDEGAGDTRRQTRRHIEERNRGDRQPREERKHQKGHPDPKAVSAKE